MAKLQTRRSISVPRDVYDRLKAVAEARGLPMAVIVERLLRAELELPERTAPPGSRGPRQAPMVVTIPVVTGPVEPARPRSRDDADMPEFSPAELRVKAQRDEQARRSEANEREERALANPCRRSGCHRQPPVHEAHDD